eukprot:IDg2861t1
MDSSTLEEVMVAPDFVDTHVVPHTSPSDEYPGRPNKIAHTSSRCLLAKLTCTFCDLYSTDVRKTGSAEAAVEIVRSFWREITASRLRGHIIDPWNPTYRHLNPLERAECTCAVYRGQTCAISPGNNLAHDPHGVPPRTASIASSIFLAHPRSGSPLSDVAVRF